jgi:hypothetical protein
MCPKHDNLGPLPGVSSLSPFLATGWARGITSFRWSQPLQPDVAQLEPQPAPVDLIAEVANGPNAAAQPWPAQRLQQTMAGQGAATRRKPVAATAAVPRD